MSNDSYHQDPAKKPDPKTAIELWALYSYNLHKATYHGLNRLSGRQNRRNFIIGRGSQTGMHRFAGLWTGDNASSWDFWRICVAQVLALGYSGLTIAGVDMGGFTKDPASSLPAPWWCDPELLIRWYTGAFLLPWYRNHYAQHFNTKEFQVRKFSRCSRLSTHSEYLSFRNHGNILKRLVNTRRSRPNFTVSTPLSSQYAVTMCSFDIHSYKSFTMPCSQI